jgi:hypothetical protein
LLGDLQLQSLDFPLLFADALLLIAHLLLQGRGHGGLPLLLLRQCGCLVVLLDQQIAGIPRVPNQTIWFRRLRSELDTLRHSSTIRSECIPGSSRFVDYERSLPGLALAHTRMPRIEADLTISIGREERALALSTRHSPPANPADNDTLSDKHCPLSSDPP